MGLPCQPVSVKSVTQIVDIKNICTIHKHQGIMTGSNGDNPFTNHILYSSVRLPDTGKSAAAPDDPLDGGEDMPWPHLPEGIHPPAPLSTPLAVPATNGRKLIIQTNSANTDHWRPEITPLSTERAGRGSNADRTTRFDPPDCPGDTEALS